LHIASKKLRYCTFIAKIIASFDKDENQHKNVSFFTVTGVNVHEHTCNNNHDIAKVQKHSVLILNNFFFSISETSDIVVTQSNNVLMKLFDNARQQLPR
jgi:hypothetical protein